MRYKIIMPISHQKPELILKYFPVSEMHNLLFVDYFEDIEYAFSDWMVMEPEERELLNSTYAIFRTGKDLEQLLSTLSFNKFVVQKGYEEGNITYDWIVTIYCDYIE